MTPDRVVIGFEDSHPERAGSRGPELPGYELLDELGRGAMGVVYRARHLALGREVAIKLLLGSSETQRRRFLREGQALARLRHPNLVGLYEVGECAQGPFLSMELVEGEDLGRRLVRVGALEPRAAAELIQGVALAVGLAHASGILHRDIKPANILVRPSGEPVLTDFGLAKMVEAESEALTRSGIIVGTPAFMPPEQLGGFVDAHSDVYSLGATLYTLLCGEPPFEGDNLLQLAAISASSPPPSLRSRGVDVPLDLETICLRCLEKEPRDRYPGALQLAHDLRRFLGGEEIEARPLSRLERGQRWIERHAVPLALACVGSALLAVVIALSAGLLLGRRHGAQSDARDEAIATSAAHDAEPSLGRALSALQAAQRWRSLDAGEPAARATQRAALELATLARAKRAWELAEEACRQAEVAGLDPARVAAERAALSEARGARSRASQATVASVLSRARAGEFVEDVERRWTGLLDLVRRSDEHTVAHLIAALEHVTARTRAAYVGLLRGTVGGTTLAGEPAAVEETLAALAAGATLTPAQAQVEARAVLAVGRALRSKKPEKAGLSERALVALALREALPGEEEAGRVCCSALGATADARAVPALSAYLRLAQDDPSAIAAGLALWRIGEEAGLRVAWEAAVRLGGTYRATVGERIPRALRGEVDEALERLRAVVKQAWAKMEAGDLNGAFRDGRAVLAKRPREMSALTLMAHVLSRRNELTEAYWAAGRALEFDPSRADLWRLRAEIGLRQTPPHPQGVLQDALSALKIDPRSGEAHALVAEALRIQKRFGQAEGYLRRAAELAPRAARVRLAQVHLARARGDVLGERSALRLLLELDPQVEHAVRLGLLLMQAPPIDRAAARRVFDAAIAKHPRAAALRFHRAGLRVLASDFAGAERDLVVAVRERPSDPAPWRLRSQIAGMRGDTKAEARALERSLELDPNQPNLIGSRGRLHAKAGRYREALVDLDRAIALRARLPRHLSHINLENRAMVLVRLERYADARRDLDLVVREAPKTITILLARAAVHVLEKHPALAKRDLTTFLAQAAPEHPRRKEAQASLAAVERMLRE